MLFQQAAGTPYPRGVPGQLRRKRIRFRRNRSGRLNPDNVYDFSRRRIDNEDHVVEHHDLIALEDRINLQDLRGRIKKLDGGRDPGSHLNREIYIPPVIAMDCGVANQDAVNAGLLLPRYAGEAIAFTAGVACGLISARAAHFGFPAPGFLALGATVLTLHSGVPLAFALLAAFGLPCAFAIAIRPIFSPVSLLFLALLLIAVVLSRLLMTGAAFAALLRRPPLLSAALLMLGR